jgi:hypothetical protein
VSEYTVKPLSTETWDAFARLCEKHNGMGFGQCWCTWFHPRRKVAQAGGVVEAYPQDTAGKKISASFLCSATRSTFEKAGFGYERPKGKNHCVMRTTVPPA